MINPAPLIEYAETCIDPSYPYGHQKLTVWEDADLMGWNYYETMIVILRLWDRFQESERIGAEFRKECNKNGNACWNWQ